VPERDHSAGSDAGAASRAALDAALRRADVVLGSLLELDDVVWEGLEAASPA